ncbi:hypothetical protein [Serratia inhibens]
MIIKYACNDSIFIDLSVASAQGRYWRTLANEPSSGGQSIATQKARVNVVSKHFGQGYGPRGWHEWSQKQQHIDEGTKNSIKSKGNKLLSPRLKSHILDAIFYRVYF